MKARMRSHFKFLARLEQVSYNYKKQIPVVASIIKNKKKEKSRYRTGTLPTYLPRQNGVEFSEVRTPWSS